LHRSYPSLGRNRSFKATPTCPTCADAFLAQPGGVSLPECKRACTIDRMQERIIAYGRAAGYLLARQDTARRQLRVL